MWKSLSLVALAALAGCHAHFHNATCYLPGGDLYGVTVVRQGMYSPAYPPPVYVGDDVYDQNGMVARSGNLTAYTLQQNAIDAAYAAARAGEYTAEQERQNRQAVEQQLAQMRGQLAAAKQTVTALQADKKTTTAQLSAAQQQLVTLQAEYDAFAESVPTPEAGQ